ncbi:MAG: TIGR04283 family arsenosugar biosynthesis glycosyltransferase [Elusimicrobia bacterium]|nr:TIGR04283 family arsenosugar biosynthesis glycosyltransferase [Elusimicrobiota bacterium]
MKFSVVIPTWNEGAGVGSNLKRLREISDAAAMEVILVDGGSRDNTVAVARPWIDHLIELQTPNRGAQLHAGAQKAKGDILFFLHADTQPPNNWQESLEKAWLQSRSSPLAATAFSVEYGYDAGLRLAAWTRNTRTRVRQIVCGDQGLATTAANYAESGGFPEIPIMEDIEFGKRLKRLGRIELLPQRILPAARRLHSRGAVLNSIYNKYIALRYALGEEPAKLWKRYYAGSRHDLPPAPPPSTKPHPFAGRFKPRG